LNLKDILLASFSSAADRDRRAAFINQNPSYFSSLLQLACAPDQNRENVLAYWILEKYALNQIECLKPNLTVFLNGALQQRNDSKRRPMAKLLFYYCINEKRRKLLTQEQIDLIVEVCFNYLLASQKTAPLAFAMKNLHFFRDHKPWIEEELQAYIKKNLPNSSAGFQSVVRQIL